jgi:hypothetical protein
MSKDDETLNYIRIVGSIPIPSLLEAPQQNEHVIDWLSAQLHRGKSLRQMCVETRAAFGLDRGDW